MRRLTTFALAALLVAALASGALAQAQLWVMAEHAPLRDARSGQAAVLAELARGESVRLLESGGPWARVRDAAGREGWMYQGHLSALPPPPALGSLFEAMPKSLVLAEESESARSSRSQGPVKAAGGETLWTVLDMGLEPAMLADFLKEGGIGEYAATQPFQRGPLPSFPQPRAAAAYGGEAERQVGMALAAKIVRDMAPPAFGMARQRYANLVGLAVARYAPGPVPPLRVVVLEHPAPLAFHLPGAVVMLSTGRMNALENEAQLALVLAHEAAHASLGHGWALAQSTQFMRYKGVVDAAGARTPLFAAMLGELSAALLHEGINPAQELDADAAAVQMAWRAGYDPQQWPRVLQLLEQAGRDASPPEGMRAWPGLHPPLGMRLAKVQPLLARLPQSGLALATERFRANR